MMQLLGSSYKCDVWGKGEYRIHGVYNRPNEDISQSTIFWGFSSPALRSLKHMPTIIYIFIKEEIATGNLLDITIDQVLPLLS
jgi:hypothetical protein